MQGAPKCWHGDWAEWNRLNEMAGSLPGRPLDHFCADCLPEFKREQARAGRCAYPEVTFVRLLERRRDPVTQKLYNVETTAVRGVRSPTDEAAWRARHEKREEERG